MFDTTNQLKEVIDSCHEVLNFGDINAAMEMARKFIELNAVVTCSGNVPQQWREFGADRNG